ncbi:MAG: hypothetical protein L0Z50_23630 [Verrucomicrobiales bacterium]|nr:hypothetical protein [Verrucomicrobiales bacterium]
MKNPIQHITNRDSLVAAFNNSGTHDFAQRTNRAHTSAGTAGRGQLRLLAILCALIAVLLMAMTVISSASTTLIGISAIAFVVLAVIAAVWFKPDLLVAAVRNFESAANDHLRLCEERIATKSADEQLQIDQAIANGIRDGLATGVSLTQIVTNLNDSIRETESWKEHLAAEIGALGQQERLAEERLRIEKSALHAAAARWSGKILARVSRKPARRAVSAIEAQTSVTERLTILRAALEIIEYGRAALVQARSRFASEIVEPLVRLRDKTKAEIQVFELQEKSGFPLVNLKPSISELRSPVETAVRTRISHVRQCLVERAQGDSADEVAQRSVADVINAAAVIPRTFGEYWSKCNGQVSLILDNVDAESKGFNVIDAGPGRTRHEIRYCLAAEGSSSPPFEPIRARSQGISVRAVTHADQSDLIVATLEKFVPGNEETEFKYAAKAFDAASKDVQDTIVYVCDTNVIRHYTPEQAGDAERGYRLLFLGLLWNQINRTRSEDYRYTNDTAKQVLIAKGWEESARQLQTDKALADHIGARIARCREADGESATESKLKEAFENAGNLVPAAAVSKFREIIREETRDSNHAE